MREILFRGKAINSIFLPKSENGWVYGVPVPILINAHMTEEVEIVEYHGYDELDYYGLLSCDEKVDPKTIGQYTGLKDKNGKMIFEGDILECVSDLVSLSGKKTGGSVVDRKVVEWGEYGWVVKKIHSSRWTSTWNTYGMKCNLYKAATKYACVIGNIHDNPELFGGEAE